MRRPGFNCDREDLGDSRRLRAGMTPLERQRAEREQRDASLEWRIERIYADAARRRQTMGSTP